MENVLIKKGTVVLIPIININTSTSYFGEDALEFKSVPFHSTSYFLHRTIPLSLPPFALLRVVR
jgi:hypothetical protein